MDEAAEEIRRRVASDVFLSARLENLGLRALGMDLSTWSAAFLAAVAGIGVRFLLPVLATTIAGQWDGAPWWRWLVIAILVGGSDAWAVHRHAPLWGSGSRQHRQPAMRRVLEDFTAMIPTIARERDVRDLLGFTRRWYRLRTSASVAVGIAITILLFSLAVAPEGVAALPIGSLVVLALLLYDFGELAFENLFSVALMTRESRYEHRLFWPSPVDSVEVRAELRVWATMQFMIGVGVTLSLVLALILVSFDSPLVLPLAGGFVVWGYITTLVSMVGVRSSIGRIATRTRDANLALLQAELDRYRDRFASLSTEEASEVEHLLTLHAAIQDAPTTPRASRAFAHAAVALVIPTAMFVLTVFGEVIAERILDALLP